MVLVLEHARQSLQAGSTSPPPVNTELVKVPGVTALTNRDAVVMKLEPMAAQPVAIRGARQSLDLEIEPHNEQRRIDERTESSPRGRVLDGCDDRVGRLNRGVNPNRRFSFRDADAERESAAVVRSQPQTADNVAPPERIVGRIEVKVPML